MMFLVKYNSRIFRNTQIYLDRVLKQYELSSGSYPYLFILDENEGISQNKVSKELGCDKAMSARTITKLITIGYIYKRQDKEDSRAYELYLTEKAKVIIPKVHEEIQNMVALITEDINEEDKLITMNSLKKILSNVKSLKV
ncbi:MAG: winged helix-turn-helix transcriptional regulator [Clostridiaceae bacterium]|nr:winged helix-turn-helix transcriptional regulator [Clostridiaceae bacterium]